MKVPEESMDEFIILKVGGLSASSRTQILEAIKEKKSDNITALKVHTSNV